MIRTFIALIATTIALAAAKQHSSPGVTQKAGPATATSHSFVYQAPGASEPTCTILAGETTATCKPGARWTEVIKTWVPDRGDLVCGVVETKVGEDWIVFEARLYCIRGRATR